MSAENGANYPWAPTSSCIILPATVTWQQRGSQTLSLDGKTDLLSYCYAGVDWKILVR